MRQPSPGWQPLEILCHVISSPSLVLPPAGNRLKRLNCPSSHKGGAGNEPVWEERECPAPWEWGGLNPTFFPLLGFICSPALSLSGPAGIWGCAGSVAQLGALPTHGAGTLPTHLGMARMAEGALNSEAAAVKGVKAGGAEEPIPVGLSPKPWSPSPQLLAWLCPASSLPVSGPGGL